MTDATDEISPEMDPPPSKRSRDIDKLAVALAKAQGMMENAKRASENPGFKRDGKNSKYSDLGSVWEAIREPLASNGLSVVQMPTTLQSGVEIETLLLHESGQYLRNILWMPCGQTMTVHTIGSAITYGRRYALMAIAGVAPEEDDGNSAAGVGEHKGVAGTASGGTEFRPAGPRQSSAHGRELAADEPESVARSAGRLKGALAAPDKPKEPTKEELRLAKIKKGVDDRITALKAKSDWTKFELSDFWTDNKVWIDWMDDPKNQADAEYQRFYAVYSDTEASAKDV